MSEHCYDICMDPESVNTPAELIDRLMEKELADLIYAYGEERLLQSAPNWLGPGDPWG